KGVILGGGRRDGGEHPPDRARRLRDALLVLDEREAHVAVAALAEADAGTDRHVRLLREAQGELERAGGAQRLRNRRPDEHRPARRLDLPARAGETRAEGVTPAAVDLAYLLGVVGALTE